MSSPRSIPLAAMLSTMAIAVVLLVVGTALYGGSYLEYGVNREIGVQTYLPMVAMGYGALVILALAIVELRFYLIRTRDLERREARLREAVEELELEQESSGESIGSFLHDDIGGGLTALRMELDLANRDPTEAAWSRCFAAVDRLLGYVRGMSRTLYPRAIGTMGLTGMLRGMADSLGDSGRQKIELDLAGPVDSLPQRISLCLLRVVQETVVNAARHSNGNLVSVRISVQSGKVSGNIADNGTGCHEIHDGLGLTLMRERIRHLGGALDVRVTKAGGMETLFQLPVEPKEAAA